MKMRIGSIFAFILVMSLITSSISAFATPSYITKTWTQVNDVVAGGEKIGTVTTSYTYERQKDSDNSILVDLAVSKHYDLLPIATEIQKQEFKDDNKRYKINVTEGKEYYVNGKKLTQQELSTPINNVAPMSFASSQDTGGIPSVSHYYGDYTNYHLASYSDLNIMGGPQGKNHQANGKVTNAYVQRAMSSIDSFTGSYNSMNTSRELFLQAAGIAIVTVEGIITAIAAGLAGASAAAACYSSFQDCKSALEKTCAYIDKI